MNEKSLKMVATGLVFLLTAMLFTTGLNLFDPYAGGWEVTNEAMHGTLDNQITKTAGIFYTKQWKTEFDANTWGAADLVLNMATGPFHVDENFNPSDDSEPIDTITKTAIETDPTTGEEIEVEYRYDIHYFKQDITFQTQADYEVNDHGYGCVSIDSETSFERSCKRIIGEDYPGQNDGGSHDYEVVFQFTIDRWEKFEGAAEDWAGVMKIYQHTQPTVGVQEYRTKSLPVCYEENADCDVSTAYTQLKHNAMPADVGELNVWTDEGSFTSTEVTDQYAPDPKIPQIVYFNLAAEMRAGALLGKNFWGDVVNIYPLDVFVIFHVIYEVLTVNKFYLASEPATLTQTGPADSGDPGTEDAESGWENFKEFVNNTIPDLPAFSAWDKLAIVLIIGIVGLVAFTFLVLAILFIWKVKLF